MKHQKTTIVMTSTILLSLALSAFAESKPATEDSVGTRADGFKLGVTSAPILSEFKPLPFPGLVPKPSVERGPATVPQRLAKSPASKINVHIVKNGETLTGISVRYNVRVAQLKALNHLKDPNRIQDGQRILIAPEIAAKSNQTKPSMAQK